MTTEIHRIAIVNRGEPAVRFLRALRDYNLERGTTLQAIACFTDPDEGATFVRLADDAIRLGPALRKTPQGGTVSAYCDHAHVIGLLQAAQCDAVWPGWGFVSEDADFVDKLLEAGITFLGPSPASMRALGDKIASKQLAEQAGVPLAPWHLIANEDSDEAVVQAAVRLGFPLMVKASGGGGGRGIRRVESADAVVAAVHTVRNEVEKVFGKGGLFLETCVTGARHIEVQLVCGADGKATALGMRDCSVQRRNQKVIEEAPCPILPEETAQIAMISAERLAELAGYRGVATAEFLYRPDTHALCFLEVNSRLQVEHTVTELVTGADLVQAQIDIARGLPWRNPGAIVHGHAIEVRLNAEDPERGFAPAPGLVRLFRTPAGPGIRVDSGVTEGTAIAPDFDSMIAKVMAWAPTRPQALARLQRALRELQVVVEDGATNKAFLLALLQHPEVVHATADTAWLDRAMAQGLFGAPSHGFEALVCAAIVACKVQRHADVQRFFAQVQGGIPHQLPTPQGLAVDLKLRRVAHRFVVHAVDRDRFLVGPEGALHTVTLEPTGTYSAVLHIAERRHQVLYSQGRAGIAVEIDGTMHVVERASGGVVLAPAPALVVHVAAREGDRVVVGDKLCTLEAMKMEMPLFAAEAGVVKTVLCRPHQQVTAGQTLFHIEPEQAEDADLDLAPPETPLPAARPLDLLRVGDSWRANLLDTLAPEDAQTVVRDLVGLARGVLLGWDIPEPDAVQLDRMLARDVNIDELAHPQRWLPLANLLQEFAAVESLFERNLLPLPGEAVAVSAELAFHEACRGHHEGEKGVQLAFRPVLLRALTAYGVHSLEPGEPLREALWRMAVAHANGGPRHRLCGALLQLLIDAHHAGIVTASDALRETLDRVAQVASADHCTVADNARQASYLVFEQSRYVQRREVVETEIDRVLAQLPDNPAALRQLIDAPHSLVPLVMPRILRDPSAVLPLGEVMLCRVYRDRLPELRHAAVVGDCEVIVLMLRSPRDQQVIGVFAPSLAQATAVLAAHLPTQGEVIAEVIVRSADDAQIAALDPTGLDQVARMTLWWPAKGNRVRQQTWARSPLGLLADPALRNIHPETADRIELWRLQEFITERLDGPEQIVAFRGTARTNPEDERVFLFAEVRDLPLGGSEKRDETAWDFEQAWFEGLRVLREAQSRQDPRRRLHWNRFTFTIRPVLQLTARDVARLSRNLEAPARGLGLEKVVIRARVPDPRGNGVRQVVLAISKPGRHRMQVEERPVSGTPIRAMSPYEMRVVRSWRLGSVFPYELVRLLEGRAAGASLPHPDMANGRFAEYDLDSSGDRLVPVQREYGLNQAGVVVGVVVHFPAKYPDGMERVWIASDPTMAMGALAEPECRRIVAALDLAEERGLPIEWVPISAGARIAMDSGTENLDWTARVLRRIVEFTQQGGDIHIIVAGINVGAQSYWNAEATMLQHTRGALIMTPEGAMVLTGKKALEVSGGVGAEDERGIGGLERIMGPNGQAQYVARDMGEAYAVLFNHYRFAYRKPHETGPRPLPTTDPDDRSVLNEPYRSGGDAGFATVGAIFDDKTNPGRKKPFAIREVMAALCDKDGGMLERWAPMLHAETAVVWDVHLGGIASTLIGFESQPLPRRGRIPLDGPDTWTGGTLFPRSSKKVARAINAASGQRPVVVLANLSGFDGSPESLRKWQLEHGAEIGRAVVNFQGPMVFVVVGRYHGGAYVVFSKALNPNLVALAVEGSFASVIGGGPAAAVVFPREVRKRAEADPRVKAAQLALQDSIAGAATAARRSRLREAYDAVLSDIVLEKQGEVAKEFDAVHSVERAVAVGSLDGVIKPDQLRSAIIGRLRDAQGMRP